MKFGKIKLLWLLGVGAFILLLPAGVLAMHISEGILPENGLTYPEIGNLD